MERVPLGGLGELAHTKTETQTASVAPCCFFRYAEAWRLRCVRQGVIHILCLMLRQDAVY